MPYKKDPTFAAEKSIRAKYRRKRYRDKGDTDSMTVLGTAGCWCEDPDSHTHAPGTPHPPPPKREEPPSQIPDDGYIPLTPQLLERHMRDKARDYGEITNTVMWE